MKRLILDILISILFVASLNCMESESELSGLIPSEQALSYRDLLAFVTLLEREKEQLEKMDPHHKQPETIKNLEENSAKQEWAYELMQQKQNSPDEEAIIKFLKYLKELETEERQLKEKYIKNPHQETFIELKSNRLLQSWAHEQIEQIEQKEASRNK